MNKNFFVLFVIIAIGLAIFFIVRYRRKDIHKTLYKAAKRGNLKKVKALIAKGADINCKNKNERTPLYIASDKGKIQVVEYLLSLKDKDGKLRVVVDSVDKDGETALHVAADEGYLPIVRFLIEVGDADINKQDKDLDTPLHKSADEGYLNIVRYLIEKKADTKIKNKKGRTPIEEAKNEGQEEVVKFLEGK